MILNGIHNSQPKTKNKGYLRATYAQSLAALPTAALSLGAMGLMNKVGNISKEDTITIKRSVSRAIKDTGLKDDGVKAVFVEASNAKSLKGIVKTIINLYNQPSKNDQKAMKIIVKETKETIRKNKIAQIYMKQLDELVGDDATMKTTVNEIVEKASSLPIMAQIKTASNACYLPYAKAVLVPDKKLITSGFHEIGHALNANKSKFWSFVQNNRKACMAATGIISTIALLTKTKATDETPAKGTEKVGHFVKKNAGILTFASMIPVIAEEAMATIKGNKIATKMLDANLLKRVKIGNALGLSTYILGAIGAAVSITAAVKVKDSIQAKHEEKVAQKAAAKAAKLAAKN